MGNRWLEFCQDEHLNHVAASTGYTKSSGLLKLCSIKLVYRKHPADYCAGGLFGEKHYITFPDADVKTFFGRILEANAQRCCQQKVIRSLSALDEPTNVIQTSECWSYT